jgi:hypothetical protein
MSLGKGVAVTYWFEQGVLRMVPQMEIDGIIERIQHFAFVFWGWE